MDDPIMVKFWVVFLSMMGIRIRMTIDGKWRKDMSLSRLRDSSLGKDHSAKGDDEQVNNKES